MFYHAFTIEHSVEKPVEELGDVVMSPLFHRVSAACPVLHVFGVVHIPVDSATSSHTFLQASSSHRDAATCTPFLPQDSATAEGTSPSRLVWPSPGPHPPTTTTIASSSAPLGSVAARRGSPPPASPADSSHATTAHTLSQNTTLATAVLVQRHACLHVHGIYPYFYVPQYHVNVTPTQFGAQLESVALRCAFTNSEACSDATSAASQAPQAPSHRQLLHNVELVHRVPFYGFHSHEHAFFKVSVIDPSHVPLLVSLLRETTHVGGRPWQPYEAHLRFHSQFMMDFGVSGMAPLPVRRCTLRCPVPPELASLLPSRTQNTPASFDEHKGPPLSSAETEAAAVRARREALGVLAVTLPDERERLTQSEVEMDMRAIDFLPTTEKENTVSPSETRGAAKAEVSPHVPLIASKKARSDIGAHLAHARRSLKQYFLHHGVPDRLRVAHTMAEEERTQEAMRKGQLNFTDAAGSAGLRYGTVEQLQRNDPAACVMRGRMRDVCLAAAAAHSRHKDDAEVDMKPHGADQIAPWKHEAKEEKPSYWLAQQQQRQQQKWEPQPAAFGVKRQTGAACPWAELEPLGPPCERRHDADWANATTAAAADHVGGDVSAPRQRSSSSPPAPLLGRATTDEIVPQTFELLDALVQPLHTSPHYSLSSDAIAQAVVSQAKNSTSEVVVRVPHAAEEEETAEGSTRTDNTLDTNADTGDDAEEALLLCSSDEESLGGPRRSEAPRRSTPDLRAAVSTDLGEANVAHRVCRPPVALASCGSHKHDVHVGDTLAFVLRLSRPSAAQAQEQRLSSGHSCDLTASQFPPSSMPRASSVDPKHVTLRVLAAGRVCAAASSQENLSVQWLLSLSETHLAGESKRLQRAHAWLPPATHVHAEAITAHAESAPLVLAGGEWLLSEASVPQDAIPVRLLQHPERLPTMESSRGDGVVAELLVCPLRVCLDYTSYTRMLATSVRVSPIAAASACVGDDVAGPRACTPQPTNTPWKDIRVVLLCRYVYSFRSRLLCPIETCHGSLFTISPGSAPRSSQDAAEACHVSPPHTQRGAFLLLPEAHPGWTNSTARAGLISPVHPLHTTAEASQRLARDHGLPVSALESIPSPSFLSASSASSSSSLSSSSSWPSSVGELFSPPPPMSPCLNTKRSTAQIGGSVCGERHEGNHYDRQRDEEAAVLLATPGSSASSTSLSDSRLQKQAHDGGDSCSCFMYTHQPIRTETELRELLAHVPFHRSVQRARDDGDLALTQGRLLHRVPSLPSPLTAVSREDNALWSGTHRGTNGSDPSQQGPNARYAREPMRREAERLNVCGKKRPRESVNISTVLPEQKRATVHFALTPEINNNTNNDADDDEEEDLPLLPFEDSPRRAQSPSQEEGCALAVAAAAEQAHMDTHIVSSLSPTDVDVTLRKSVSDVDVLSMTRWHVLSPPTQSVASEDEKRTAANNLDTDRGEETREAGEDDEVMVLTHMAPTVRLQKIPRVEDPTARRRREEVVLSHSTSPLSVRSVFGGIRDGVRGRDQVRVPWHTVTPAIVMGTSPCAPRASEAHSLPRLFLCRRGEDKSEAAQPCLLSASTWPLCGLAESAPGGAPEAHCNTATASKAAEIKRTTTPDAKPAPHATAAAPPVASASTGRRSATTLSSHHFLSCELRVLHVEVLLNRREATQQVAGDPLLAVALGQGSSGQEAMGVCLFCVAPTRTTSSTQLPPPPLPTHDGTPFSDDNRRGSTAEGRESARFSIAELPRRHQSALLGRSICLTDKVTVVELPSERALLLRVQHEMVSYDPDVIASWEGFKYGIGLLALRYRAVLGRTLARDLSRLRPTRNVLDELTRQKSRQGHADMTDTFGHSERAPFRVAGLETATSPSHAAPIADPFMSALEGDVDEDVDALAAAVAAYNLDVEEEATDVPTAVARRYAQRFGANVRIVGRVVSSISKDIRKTVKLASHSLPFAHAALTGQSLPYFSDTTLARLYAYGQHATSSREGADGRAGYQSFVLRYLLAHTMGVRRVTTHLHYHTQAVEFSRLYGVLYEEAIVRGSQFKVEATLCRIARPQGYLLLSPSIDATHRQPRIQRIPLILQPKSNFYKDPVIVLDFRSLYPSVVIAYNLCYSTCMGLVQSEARGRLGVLPRYEKNMPQLHDLLVPGSAQVHSTSQEEKRGGDRDEAPAAVETDTPGLVISPNGAMFVAPFVREGVLPQMLRAVLDTRFEVQAADKCVAQPLHDEVMHTRLQEQQLALKMLANTTYGYTAASYTGRMPCVDLAEAIVAFGRQTLERAIALVHERADWGAEVVYGDTDSLFLHLPGRTREEAFEIGEVIAKAVTASNPAPITLQFEKVIQPCLLLVKKRYAGYAWFSRAQSKPTFLAKGIETVRRDQCEMTSSVVKTLLQALFDGASSEQLRRTYTDAATAVQRGATNPAQFIFRRAVKLGRYQDEQHLPLAAHLALKQMQRDLLKTPFWGERLPYVVCRSLVSAKLKDQVVSPQELIASSSRLTIDTEYYMRNHVNAALDRMFYLVGISFSRWYAEMARRRQWSSYMSVEAFLHLQTRRRLQANKLVTATSMPGTRRQHMSRESSVLAGDCATHRRRARGRTHGCSNYADCEVERVDVRDDTSSQVPASLSSSSSSSWTGPQSEHTARLARFSDEEDGGAPERPVDVEREVGETPDTLSPITVEALSPLDSTPCDTTSVIDIDEDDHSGAHGTEATTVGCDAYEGEVASRHRASTKGATQRVDGMRTLDSFYPRALCVVCEQRSVTLEAHQEQLHVALGHRHRRNAPHAPHLHHHAPRSRAAGADGEERLSRAQDSLLRAVPPICAVCWTDPLALFARVQTCATAVARRLHRLEECCQICMGSLGHTGGHTHLKTLCDLEELVAADAVHVQGSRPSCSGVPRELSHPVTFITLTEARASAAAAATGNVDSVRGTVEDDALAHGTFGCTSLDCDIVFDKRKLFLENRQLQALSWYLRDVL